jgi:DNA-binding NarL/FixJ family response regulator
VALRTRIVLLSAEGLSNTEVARRVHVTLATVGKWRQRTLQLENASATSSIITTRIRNPLYGPSPPTKSSTPSLAFVNEH